MGSFDGLPYLHLLVLSTASGNLSGAGDVEYQLNVVFTLKLALISSSPPLELGILAVLEFQIFNVLNVLQSCLLYENLKMDIMVFCLKR